MIRPRYFDEPAIEWRSPLLGIGAPGALRGSVGKRRQGISWWLAMECLQRQSTWTGEICLESESLFAEVRASIVAMKRRNGRGAKGGRKVDT